MATQNLSKRSYAEKYYVFTLQIHHLICGPPLWLLLLSFLLNLTFITNTSCWVANHSPYTTLGSKKIFLFYFLIKNLSILKKSNHNLKCDKILIYFPKALAIVRSKSIKKSVIDLPSTFIFLRTYLSCTPSKTMDTLPTCPFRSPPRKTFSHLYPKISFLTPPNILL